MTVVDHLAGGIAPPMQNGEVVFEAPWQGRVFGMARALAAAGAFEWDDFRACLIEEVAGWDRRPEGEFAYYDHFMRALERLLVQRRLVEPAALGRRVEAFAARAHDHDHGHHHDGRHGSGHGPGQHSRR